MSVMTTVAVAATESMAGSAMEKTITNITSNSKGLTSGQKWQVAGCVALIVVCAVGIGFAVNHIDELYKVAS